MEKVDNFKVYLKKYQFQGNFHNFETGNKRLPEKSGLNINLTKIDKKLLAIYYIL